MSSRNAIRACVIVVAAFLNLGWPTSCNLYGEDPDRDSSSEPVETLRTYCLECHGPETKEANLQFDGLVSGVGGPPEADAIRRALVVVRSQTMPPEDSPAPSSSERGRLVEWLAARLDRVSEKNARPIPRVRRLSREEYQYTMQDLFAVESRFDDLLPADPISPRGYRNAASQLGMSSLQIESYLDSARRAVNRYVQFRSETLPDPLRYHIEFEDLYYSTSDRYGTREKAPQPISSDEFQLRREQNRREPIRYVDPLSPSLPGAYSEDEKLRAAIPKLHQQYVALTERLPEGELIVRIRASGTKDRDGRVPRMRVEAGITLGDGCSIDKRLLGEVDVDAAYDAAQEYEFRIRLEDVPTKGPQKDGETFDRLSVFDLDQIFISNVSSDPKAIFDRGRGAYSKKEKGSKSIADQLDKMRVDQCNMLHLDCIEVEMFPGFGLDNGPARWFVDDSNENETDSLRRDRASRFLTRVMSEAYRRAVTKRELEQKLSLYDELRERQYSFRESLSETIAAALVSPAFLYREMPLAGEDDELPSLQADAIASRLSYLLWLSAPDRELRRCGDDGSLSDPAVRRREAERMLADPKSRRLLSSFVRQWLRLDKYANVSVDRDTYPLYDADLADDAVDETVAFFVEVVENDSSVFDLIDSSYLVINDRMATHYGITPKRSGEYQRYPLEDRSQRGGLLTHASVLTINADGKDSHPIRRGTWVLDRFLNRPPPPPPPNVPDIDADDPNLRGLSLRQRIEVHRNEDGCRNCHRQIDPWGLVFENYDATGKWRFRTKDGPVDASARFDSDDRVGGVRQFKDRLLDQHRAEFAHAFVHHFLTYAMGAEPSFADRGEIQSIQKAFATSGFRIRDMILAYVESRLFVSRSAVARIGRD